MPSHAYLFQAKGIQPYILDNGKLKEMAGASELVARLCRSHRADLLQLPSKIARNKGCAGARSCVTARR
jgi:hypothetical protein